MAARVRIELQYSNDC